MSVLYAVIGGFVVLLAFVIWLWVRAGKAARDAQRVNDLEGQNDVQKRQIEIANRPPASRAELLERMRKQGL